MVYFGFFVARATKGTYHSVFGGVSGLQSASLSFGHILLALWSATVARNNTATRLAIYNF